MLLFRTCCGNSWAAPSVPPLPPPLPLAIKQSRSDTDKYMHLNQTSSLWSTLQACVNNTFKSKLGQSHPMALKALQDRGARIQSDGYILGCSQRLTLRLRRSAWIGYCCLNAVTIWRVHFGRAHIILGIARSLAPYTRMNNHIQKSLSVNK